MVRVVGPLRFVTSNPAEVSEVWVRAPKVRTHGEGVVTTGNDRFPVIDGEVSFTAVPGPAVLALISQGRAVDTIPILVGDGAEQTLRQVVEAAEVADDTTKREIEKLAAQAVELLDSSTANAQKAQDGAQRAETAAGEAGASASAASGSASAAATSQKRAGSSATAAATAERNAAEHASEAARHEVAAQGYAEDAEESAESAGVSADRAATIAGSTRWVGTRLEVNGQLSQELMPEITISDDGTWVVEGVDTGVRASGADGEPGRDGTMTFEELTPEQRASLKGDKGDPGEPGRDGKPGTTTWAGITDKPAVFPPASHTHTLADITNAPNSHTSAQTASTLMSRDSAGRARVNNPSNNLDIANRQYVDGAVAGVVVQVSSPPSSPRSGVLYVIPE